MGTRVLLRAIFIIGRTTVGHKQTTDLKSSGHKTTGRGRGGRVRGNKILWTKDSPGADMNILIWKFTNKHQEETDPYLLLGLYWWRSELFQSNQTETQLSPRPWHGGPRCQCIIHYEGFLTEKQTEASTAGYFEKKGRAPHLPSRRDNNPSYLHHFRLTTFPGPGPGLMWKYYGQQAFLVRDFEVSNFCCVIILLLHGRVWCCQHQIWSPDLAAICPPPPS